MGATLANFLGKDGWRVAVIDASNEIYAGPRAIHCDDEAQRIWQDAAVLRFVRPSLGDYPPVRQFINANGQVYFETYVSPDKTFGYPGHACVHQSSLEVGLRQGASRYDRVETFLGVEAKSLTQDSELVTIQTVEQETGETGQIQARYVVGCDGVDSFVRRAVGIEVTDLKFDQTWLITDFCLKRGVTPTDIGLPNAHQQISDPDRPINFIPYQGKNRFRFEFMLVDGVTKEEAAQNSYIEERLRDVIDREKIDLVSAAVYKYGAQIAERWRNGRVFIAGDAAHQMPPFAGQGMCSGLRDVQNLSWKLSLVLSGAAGDRLLDSYEDERKPHVSRMIKGSIFLGNLSQPKNPLRAWGRDLLFRTGFNVPSMMGQVDGFGLGVPSLESNLRIGWIPEVVGSWFIQPQVTDAAGKTYLLDKLLGPGFSVLGYGVDPSPYFNAAESQLPVRCLTIGTGSAAVRGDVFDSTGALAKWFRAHQTDFVVIRPDRFVMGAYSRAHISNAADELVEHLNA